MKGWILYKRCKNELTDFDHGVNHLLSAAETMNIELEVLRPDQFDLMSALPGAIRLNGQMAQLPDFVIPRIGADTPVFALALIRQLETEGVYSANSALAIERVKDKFCVNQLLAAKGLPVPKTMLLQLPPPLDWIEQEIGFPLIMKTITGARGIGVHLCDNINSFNDILGLFQSTHPPRLLVQQMIASSYGRDLRVLVLGGKIIGCMLRKAKNSFKANYSLGGDVALFPMTPEIEGLALAATEIVGLELCGIDLLFGEHGLVICEANSSPGFKGMELAGGENIAEKILQYIVTQVASRKVRA